MRRGRPILIALALGLFLNFAVAIACALWSPTTRSLYRRHNSHPTPEFVAAAPAEWFAPQHASDQDTNLYELLGEEGFGIQRTTYGRLSEPVSTVYILYNSQRTVVEAGWPLATLGGRLEHDLKSTNDRNTAPPPAWLRPQSGATIPTRPLLLGSIVNTLLFAACMLTARRVTMHTVQRFRRRKGWCPKCGYDRNGIAAEVVCPECGAAATKT